MGHLAIVNQTTIQSIGNSNPYISIGGILNKRALKTVSDLFADALTVRDGDTIFTWCIDDKNTKGFGFDRYYIANGKVEFDNNDPSFPIKIGVKSGEKYANPVPEDVALDIFSSKLLWNAIGKKSLGRGRSLSHQTRDEDDQLLQLLNNANAGNKTTQLINNPQYKTGLIPISINKFGPQLYSIQQNTPLNKIPLQNIVWNNGNEFVYEKTLEAYLCENIDKPSMNFCSLIGHNGYRVVWHGNYLPYGVAGRNIDLVCEITNEHDSIIVVVELKKDAQTYRSYKKIIDAELNPYASFIANAFKSYGHNNVKVEKVLLTHNPKSPLPSTLQQYCSTKWIGYDININQNQISFTKIL